MANDIEFSCPHCAQAFSLPSLELAKYAGQYTICTSCNKSFAYPGADPAAAEIRSSRVPTLVYGRLRRRPGPSIGEFLAFRAMVTPIFIQIIFWIGVAFYVISGLITLTASIRQDFRGNTTYDGWMLFWGLAQLTAGPLFWRITCEILIIIFRIHDSVKDIRDSLHEK